MVKIQVLKDILEANDSIAQELRDFFKKKRILVVNLLSSPGAGKTLLLEKTIQRLKKEFRIAVVEGDVATMNDAKRLAKHKVPVVQITTESFGGACHLDANMVKKALQRLDLSGVQILFIENIGNLICPAEFDVGEDRRVIVLSVTEGEDKPTKYPVAFRTAHAVLINKIDLLPHLDVSAASFLKNARKVNPEVKTIQLSAKTGDGLEGWVDWLKKQYRGK